MRENIMPGSPAGQDEVLILSGDQDACSNGIYFFGVYSPDINSEYELTV